MSAKTPDTRGRWVAWIAGAAALVLVWILMGGGATDPNEKPVIRTGDEYQDVLRETEKLSLQTLKDLDAGREPTEAEKKNLKRAALLMDALSDFKPENLGTWVGAGRIYQVLGQHDLAINRFQQGLLSMPPTPDIAVKDTAIEAHYLLSVSLFNVGDFNTALKEVSTAIKAFPLGSPIYLSQRAAIYMEMRRYEEANNDLTRALELDPMHARSRQLLKFLLTATTKAVQQVAMNKLNKKDYKGVIAEANKGLKMAVADPALLALRAAAYLELGEKKKAKADVDSLLALNPNNPDALLLLKRLK